MLALSLIAAFVVAGVVAFDHASSSSTPTTRTASRTRPSPSPTTLPGPASAGIALTTTDRSVGVRYTTYEGEVSGPKNLHGLGVVCSTNTPSGCTTIVHLVDDDTGPMLWIANGGPLPHSSIQVTRSFALVGLGPAQSVHFADAPVTAPVVAVVHGASDPTHHWTDIVAAWTVDPIAGTVTRHATTGLTVLDDCALGTAAKHPSWC
jgi:hypothetical protein